MQCTKITNTSDDNVSVELRDGVKITMPKGTQIEDVDIRNLDEIKTKVSYIRDLTEVCGEQGKTKIFG